MSKLKVGDSVVVLQNIAPIRLEPRNELRKYEAIIINKKFFDKYEICYKNEKPPYSKSIETVKREEITKVGSFSDTIIDKVIILEEVQSSQNKAIEELIKDVKSIKEEVNRINDRSNTLCDRFDSLGKQVYKKKGSL